MSICNSSRLVQFAGAGTGIALIGSVLATVIFIPPVAGVVLSATAFVAANKLATLAASLFAALLFVGGAHIFAQRTLLILNTQRTLQENILQIGLQQDTLHIQELQRKSAQVRQLQTDLADARAALYASSLIIVASPNPSLAELEEQLEKKTAQIETLEDDFKAKIAELTEEKKALAEASTRFAQLEQQLEKKAAQIETLENDFKAKVAELTEEKKALAEASTRFAQLEQQKSEEILRNERELAEQAALINDLANQMDRNQGRLLNTPQRKRITDMIEVVNSLQNGTAQQNTYDDFNVARKSCLDDLEKKLAQVTSERDEALQALRLADPTAENAQPAPPSQSVTRQLDFSAAAAPSGIPGRDSTALPALPSLGRGRPSQLTMGTPKSSGKKR